MRKPRSDEPPQSPLAALEKSDAACGLAALHVLEELRVESYAAVIVLSVQRIDGGLSVAVAGQALAVTRRFWISPALVEEDEPVRPGVSPFASASVAMLKSDSM